jgi:pimeloyl-ACP methyl ester carboxylesterase
MPTDSDKPIDDLRGATRLAVDAVVAVTDLVEAMHRTVNTLGGRIGAPERTRTRGLTGFVYSSIRTLTRLAGGGLDMALAPLLEAVDAATPSRGREAVIAALNGVFGDYLVASDNPLAISMDIRRDGKSISEDREGFREAISSAEGRLLLMVHGSSANDLQWTHKGHNHGETLADDLGCTAAYLHYNSGRHISENGEELAEVLDSFLTEFPEIRELAIVAHSMGGLVSRSACHYSAVYGWPDKLTKLVCLATPHHGAPLERYGNWLEHVLQISSYSAPFARLGRIRSAGITDLRFGYLIHADWQDRERFELGGAAPTPLPLPDYVECYALAATVGGETGHVNDHIIGDGLVPLNSALGLHDEPTHDLGFPKEHRHVVRETGHLGILCSDEAYEVLLRWLDA